MLWVPSFMTKFFQNSEYFRTRYAKVRDDYGEGDEI